MNIPFDELPQRLHELPGKSETVLVADVENALQTVEWLCAGGRTATIVPYEFGEPGERLWRPTAFLFEALPCLKPGSSLDLACGTGRDAVALASLGWRVTGVDLLPDAIERAVDLERRYVPPGSPKIAWRVDDVENVYYDESTLDLVTMFRFLNRRLVARAQSWLRPGGSLLLETFTIEHRDRYGHPALRHCLHPGELISLVPDLDIVELSAAWRNGNHTARLWAKRPG